MGNVVTAREANTQTVPAIGQAVVRKDATLRNGLVVAVSVPDAHGDCAVTVEFEEYRETARATSPVWIFWSQWGVR
jgi:hypothetical protein